MFPVGSGIFRHAAVVLPGFAGGIGIHPGFEIGRGQVGEMQQQVGEVALGVDHDGRDILQGGFFEQTDAQAGLA